MAGTKGTKLIADNRRARHDYELLERFEAGVALVGTEVKSLRSGTASLQHAYALVRDGDVWLAGANIPEYPQASRQNHHPERERKLLLHRREIDELTGKVAERGLTLVPTRLYFKDGKVKVEIALARGKDVRDKRRDIAERDAAPRDGAGDQGAPDRRGRDPSPRLQGRSRPARQAGSHPADVLAGPARAGRAEAPGPESAGTRTPR